jgi:hypothetical protein
MVGISIFKSAIKMMPHYKIIDFSVFEMLFNKINVGQKNKSYK